MGYMSKDGDKKQHNPDDILRRMLNTPPKPKEVEKEKPKSKK